jgi:hypothetical protein
MLDLPVLENELDDLDVFVSAKDGIELLVRGFLLETLCALPGVINAVCWIGYSIEKMCEKEGAEGRV